MIKGNVAALSRRARADEAQALAIAAEMDRLNMELRLDRMLEHAAQAIRSGAPLAMRITRPDGRVSFR